MTGRITIIDGTATNRILMKVRLTSACYDVATFTSAQEAIHSLRQSLPDIVIIGMSLPDMASTDLCRLIRSLPGCRGLPVLMQAPDTQRLAALSAGATAIIEASYDELTLLARIRGVLRDVSARPEDETALAPAGRPRPGPLLSPGQPPPDRPPADPHCPAGAGMAEGAADFDPFPVPRLTLVSDHGARALGWRHALQGELGHRINVCDPDQALAGAHRGEVPDLYLIPADIHQPGDGLRLLSELRSRSHSRHAGFLVLLHPERHDMTAVALDLGAGDVLPTLLPDARTRAEAAIRVRTQIERKRMADRRRQETRRNLLWAMIDPLTGLYNRRFAMPHLAGMIAESRKSRHLLSVMVMDIDHFKHVNDLHGHAAGDLILTHVARRLCGQLPDDGLLARIGGEEFLCAIPADRPETALSLAQRMRLAISAEPFRLSRQAVASSVPISARPSPSLPGPPMPAPSLDITISMGLSFLPPDSPPGHPDGADPSIANALIAAADYALLSAKALGRNRIEIEQRVMTA